MIYGFTERVTTSHAFGTMSAWIEEGDIYKGFFSPGPPRMPCHKVEACMHETCPRRYLYLYIRSRNTHVGFGKNGWGLGLTIIE